jgi:hypothetical protein
LKNTNNITILFIILRFFPFKSKSNIMQPNMIQIDLMKLLPIKFNITAYTTTSEIFYPCMFITNVVKVSIALTMSIFTLVFINKLFSVLTFKSHIFQLVESGVYLLFTSTVSILIMLTFLLKFWLLLLSQMAFLIDRSLLLFNCKTIIHVSELGLWCLFIGLF